MNTNNTAYTKEQSVAFTDAIAMETKAHNLMVKEVMNQAPHGTLLDLGCGDGYLFKEYKKMGFKNMIGLDASLDILSIAKEKHSDVTFIHSILPNINLPTASIDTLVSMYAVQNIQPKDMQKFYQECYRVLKPGGTLTIFTKSPIQQFLKKIEDQGEKANYFTSEMVSIKILDGALTVTEPSHTLTDYLSLVDCGFTLTSFSENSEFPASRKIMGDDYPTFIIFSATKK
ncbi:class I SAM-dependent methyltransferase [Candidatus Nomurabacteria bacterium]|nr:class I SAM-dependent methyltransferase [Candidatus Nomurabacteria bacterium]